MSVHIIYYKDGAKWMRPVTSRPEYLALRNSGSQVQYVAAIREGEVGLKSRLVQMNYSCLPNADGSLRGSQTASDTVGMDIDFTAPDGLTAEEQKAWRAGLTDEEFVAWRTERMAEVPERVMAKREELGVLMLERSASKGYHLVFRRRPELSQEENLRRASDILGVAYDRGAKDITRVFYTTTASGEDLLWLDDEIFRGLSQQTHPQTHPQTPPVREGSGLRAEGGCSDSAPANERSETPLPHGRGEGVGLLGEGLGLFFKGIPYATIIAEFWRRTGGIPTEGERNVRLYKLAVNMRAICDNRKDLLMAVMPRFGLSEAELRGIVDSACKETVKGSRLMDAICADLMHERPREEGDDAAADDKAKAAATEPPFSPKKLPVGLRESLAGVPERMHMPVLCAVLPIAAAYADQVEVEYCDGQRQRLGLMSIIRGEQASGKSVCKAAVDVWKRQLDEEDAVARRREEEWKERKKARKASEKAPEDPHVLIRVLPVTVSCSTLLRRLKNASGHALYSFGEELDTLRKTNGAGSWSSKYDIYRLSFDYGEWGQDYNSDQAESGIIRVAYNWTMLGTNGAMNKCFRQDNIENGLSSRILVAEMPDSAFQKMPKFGQRSADDEARIQEAASRLRAASGFIDTPRLRRAIELWAEAKRVEAAKDIDYVKDTYRKRAAVIGFRCGVVFHLLTGKPKETKQCLEFATAMADYCLEQQIRAFGQALESQYVDAGRECQRHGVNHSIFDQLPPTFTIDDLRAFKRGYCSEQSLRMIISRWRKDGWLTKTDARHWTKVTT